MEDKDIKLLTEICYLYYNCDLTMAKIAKQLNMTRQNVSKFIKKAKDDNFVQIYINSPITESVELEYELKEVYGLKDVIVIKNQEFSQDHLEENLGFAAANYIKKILKPQLNIGIDSSPVLKHMSEIFSRMSYLPLEDINLIQIRGSVNGISYTGSSGYVIGTLAKVIKANEIYLYAPCIVKNLEIKNICLSEPNIKDTLNYYEDLDIAFVGINEIDELNDLTEPLSISAQELESIHQSNSVGSICFNYYNDRGYFFDHPLKDRIIGINSDELKKTKNVVVISGGEKKRPAILGALKSGVVDSLITDKNTAKYVLSKK